MAAQTADEAAVDAVCKENPPAAERSIPLALRCLGEFLGTGILVLFGCGAVHSAVLTGALTGLWQVAIVWGVAIMLACYTVGAISGAHINPAITLALAAWGRFSWRMVWPYIGAQVAGAFAAATLLFVLFQPYYAAREAAKQIVRGEPGSELTAMCFGEYFPNPGELSTCPGPYSAAQHEALNGLVTPLSAFLAELFGTLVLAFVVFAVTDDANRAGPPAGLAPVFIGLTVAGMITFLAPLTQACFNPARDFGPRLFAFFAGWGPIALPGPRGLGFLTVYILAPVLGALAGGGVYRQLLSGGSSMLPGHRPVTIAILLIVLSLLTSSGSAAEQPALDPQRPYRAERLHPVTYDVDFSVVVTAPYHTKLLKVWLPLPQSDHGQEMLASHLTTFPQTVVPQVGTENTYGNKFAYFEFPQPQGAQVIRHQFQIRVWELHWHLDASKVVAVDSWPSSFDVYRRGERQAVVVDDRFSQLLDQIVPKRTNGLEEMSAIMDWVIKDFQYDHGNASLQANAVHALTQHRGHCSDYHGFCAAMGRVLGYPTRVTYGLAAFPKNSPSHCKLEAFLPPYGWVSFDVSETQKLAASILQSRELDESARTRLAQAARNRLLRGFKENSWISQTKGTEYDLQPPASQRVSLIRTAYVEADGVRLPEPDPANPNRREFAWMTVHQYTADQPIGNAFTDLTQLEAFAPVVAGASSPSNATHQHPGE